MLSPQARPQAGQPRVGADGHQQAGADRAARREQCGLQRSRLGQLAEDGKGTVGSGFMPEKIPNHRQQWLATAGEYPPGTVARHRNPVAGRLSVFRIASRPRRHASDASAAEAGHGGPGQVSPALGWHSLGWHSLDRHSLDRHSLDRHSLGQHSLDRHSLRWLGWLSPGWLVLGWLGRRAYFCPAARGFRCHRSGSWVSLLCCLGLGVSLAWVSDEDLVAPDVEWSGRPAAVESLWPGERADGEQGSGGVRHAPVVGWIPLDADHGNLAALARGAVVTAELVDCPGQSAV